MKKVACLLAAIYFGCGQAAVADEFKNVKCASDIPKALIGQHASNEPVVVTEKRHRALGLKHLGADETSDQLSSIDWLICGSEFVTLVDRKGFVRDAIAFPPHSRKAPAYSGYCELNGRKLPDIFVAVLDGGEQKDDYLPVLSAWKIDLKGAKFIKASSEGLRCPRSGIYTVDGGR